MKKLDRSASYYTDIMLSNNFNIVTKKRHR